MADPLAIAELDDVEMQASGVDGNEDGEDEGIDVPDVVESADRVSFLEYLKSPIVELAVGSGAEATVLSAHQDLLTQSPFFEQACAELPPTGQRRLILLDEDLEAMGSFVEYLYRGDYFPRTIDDALETHPSLPAVDSDGSYLLRHARVYTLADKFGLDALKTLARSKIHGTTSTARGEIAYARFVYANTAADDTTIRQPVAAFWGTRSHVLRHEAEEEFRAMCLEFPQFGFDVLSMVLDQKEKKAGGGRESTLGGITVGVETPGTGRGRKRQRNV